MSHTPLLPTGPRPAGASETERAGKRDPLPRRGLPAEGGPVLATCPAGTQGDSGPGGRPRWRRGAVAEPVPGAEREREPHARGRYQAAAVRRARAVTWLAPGSSARNGGKRQSRGRAAFLPREVGSGQLSRGFRTALARAGLL